jgi:hypothetical protein
MNDILFSSRLFFSNNPSLLIQQTSQLFTKFRKKFLLSYSFFICDLSCQLSPNDLHRLWIFALMKHSLP